MTNANQSKYSGYATNLISTKDITTKDIARRKVKTASKGKKRFFLRAFTTNSLERGYTSKKVRANPQCKILEKVQVGSPEEGKSPIPSRAKDEKAW